MTIDNNDFIKLTRRGFMKKSSLILGLIMGGLLGIPFIGSIIKPGNNKAGASFSKVGSLDSIPVNKPINIPFLTSSEDAYLNAVEMHNIWILKDEKEQVTSYSPICPHLGCSFNWNEKVSHFECPCHTSVWDISGKLLSGPSPRDLDKLPIEIRNNEIFVRWEKFRIGIPQRITT